MCDSLLLGVNIRVTFMVIFAIFQLCSCSKKKNLLGGLTPNGSEHPVYNQYFIIVDEIEKQMRKITKVETNLD